MKGGQKRLTKAISPQGHSAAVSLKPAPSFSAPLLSLSLDWSEVLFSFWVCMVDSHAVNVTSPCVFIDTLPQNTTFLYLPPHSQIWQASTSEERPLWTVSLGFMCLCAHTRKSWTWVAGWIYLCQLALRRESLQQCQVWWLKKQNIKLKKAKKNKLKGEFDFNPSVQMFLVLKIHKTIGSYIINMKGWGGKM